MVETIKRKFGKKKIRVNKIKSFAKINEKKKTDVTIAEYAEHICDDFVYAVSHELLERNPC